MKILGGILLATGILIAGLSGLCSAILLLSEAGGPNFTDGLGIVAIFGGIPFVFGIGLVLGGMAVLKVGPFGRQ